MVEEKSVHPGSWLGDSVEEFKNLPPWGKAAAIGVVGMVAFLGYRAYASSRSSTTSGTTAGTTGTGGTLSLPQVAGGQDISGGGAQSPFAQVPSGPTANSVPVLPAGLQPIFDGVGNLIGWQPSTPSASVTSVGSGTPTPTTTPTPSSPVPPVPSQGPIGDVIEYIRAAFSQGSAASYDQTHSGVPIRSSASAGNNVIGTLAYGTPIDITKAQQVTGTSNFGPGNTSGSNVWYKLPGGGYVSAYDITPSLQPHYTQTQPPAQPKVS